MGHIKQSTPPLWVGIITILILIGLAGLTSLSIGYRIGEIVEETEAKHELNKP